MWGTGDDLERDLATAPADAGERLLAENRRYRRAIERRRRRAQRRQALG